MLAGGVIDSVEDAPAVNDCGLNETSEPDGTPVALSPTVWAAPWITAVVTVTEAAVPATSVADGGTLSENSLGSR